MDTQKTDALKNGEEVVEQKIVTATIEPITVDKLRLGALKPERSQAFADQVATAMGEETLEQLEASKDREFARLDSHPAPSSAPKIAIEYLRESPTNPRKRWGDLDELAGTIRTAGGLIHALVVRAIALLDGQHPDHQLFEIVCGARRFRAAKLAGFTELPCDVRVLSDDHAHELQLIENLQRADLHPLEEAEGYAAMKKIGYTVPTIAARLKKSTGWVYGRLKLTELGPEAVSWLHTGKLELGVAIVLARQPHSRQPEALRGLERIAGIKEQIGYLQTEFAKNLKGAPFDLKDTTLPRLGGFGDCVTCPKNSNNEPAELFADYARIERAGVCSNTPCFGARCDAVVAIKLEKAKANGAEVLTLAQTKKAIVAGAPASGSPYVIATDRMADDPKGRTWRQFFEEKLEKVDMPAVTVAPSEKDAGQVIHLYDRKQAVELAVDNGAKWAKRQAPAKGPSASKAKIEASNAKARIIAETVDQSMPKLIEKWSKVHALPELRVAASIALESCSPEQTDVLVSAFTDSSPKDSTGALAKWIERAANVRELITFTTAALVYPRWQNGSDELDADMKSCAKAAGVDLAEIGRAQLAAAKSAEAPPVKWKKIDGGEEAVIDGETYGVSFNGGGKTAGYFYKGPTGSGAACDSIEAGKLKLLELAGVAPKQVKPSKAKAVRA